MCALNGKIHTAVAIKLRRGEGLVRRVRDGEMGSCDGGMMDVGVMNGRT